jgi:REP element-mobilizing transposase RayT
MARQARIQFENAFYQVTFRGNERRAIFRDDDDRRRFLAALEDRVDRYGIRLFLFCLMTNHVHLLLQTPRGNLSAFMGSLLTAYGTYFNRRHRRHGHLTQGRFSSPLVEANRHLLWLSRYVHLNPAHVESWRNKPLSERRKYLRTFPWSSYLSYIGRVKPFPFIDYGMALDQVAGKKSDQRRAYRVYVEEGLVSRDWALEEAMGRSPLAIGSELFADAVERYYEKHTMSGKKGEDLVGGVTHCLIDPEVLIEAAGAFYGMDREELTRFRKKDRIKPVLAMLLTRHGGLNQRQVAGMLGLSTGAAVCHQLRKFREDESGEMQTSISSIVHGMDL